MEITPEQFEKIKDSLPIQRGNVTLPNLQVVNAILFIAEQGCKWRGLPERFGKWHSVYTRLNRWSKNGVLERVFEKLQQEQIVRIKIEAFSLDSTIVKVHPDGTGALKKRTAGHRQIAWRMDRQNSSGCRGFSNGHNPGAVVRQRKRCPLRRTTAARTGTDARWSSADHG
jgi:transposase